MILISSHIDRVKSDFSLKFDKGVHQGLLDNFIGVLLTYLVLYSDKNILELEKEGMIKIWHNTSEEWGRLDNSLPDLAKCTVAVVIDVCNSQSYKGYDVVLENATVSNLRDIKKYLEWHGLKVLTKKYTGEIDDEDEAWYFRKLKIPTLSFIIPVDGDFHRYQEDTLVTSEQMNKSIFALRRLINYLTA